MIILDTNVVSELMRGTPHPTVRAWMNGQSRDALVTTAVTVMELRAGVEKLLQSRRRQELEADIEWALNDLVGHRVLSYDRKGSLRDSQVVRTLPPCRPDGRNERYADCRHSDLPQHSDCDTRRQRLPGYLGETDQSLGDAGLKAERCLRSAYSDETF